MGIADIIWMLAGASAIVLPIVLFPWLWRQFRALLASLSGSATELGTRMEALDLAVARSKQHTAETRTPVLGGDPAIESLARQDRARVKRIRQENKVKRLDAAQARWAALGLCEERDIQGRV
ncbi:MAG: hypothetical protein Q4G30_03520 [Actinomycetaceae bacterium]|nr:hypothetical protein [Actinomycetaceae bacterium]